MTADLRHDLEDMDIELDVMDTVAKNLHDLEKIVASPPSLFAESSFNRAVKKLDKSIVELMNAQGLEKVPERKSELETKEKAEPSSKKPRSK